MSATITSKGQITIPKAVRDQLSLNVGDRIDFVLAQDGRFDLIPIKSSVKSLKGCVTPPKKLVTIEAMTKAIRLSAKRRKA